LALLAAVIAFWGGAIVRDYRGRSLKAIRDVLIWVAAGLLLMVGYSFRNELSVVFDRLAGELRPAGVAIATADQGERAVVLRRRGDGHFVARADINGRVVTMLVDTGASTVVLKAGDAQRAGIEVEKLNYVVPVQTANGTAFAARVRLQEVAVGPIVLRNVEGLVAKPGALEESLLGMSFLSQLRSYEFSGDYLTLRG
jgi:aspartyl protease family protein